MHVTYWNTPRRQLDTFEWTDRYEADFWSFQISDQSDCCHGGITESVWAVPGTLSCE